MDRLLWFLAFVLTTTHGTVVEISNGKLQGTYNGRYYSFLNIPFAAELARFEDPLPYTDKWAGIRNATLPSVSCVQFSRSVDPSNGQENCLILNVFTKHICPKQLSTVRVFLYGGGFMLGDAGGIAEQYVVEENVVVVIPNYRVGPFGFLSSGNDFIGGNFGLKDQLMALKWVRENIHAFGGNMDEVHLTGVSAGGASVQAHLLNPKSWSYFNAAISSSGSVLCNWAWQNNPSEQFKRYINYLDCALPNRQLVKSCLQFRTKEEHFAAAMALKSNFSDNPFNVFGVVAESKHAPNAFLTDHPRSLIERGQISEAPWVVAYSEREGTYTASELMAFGDNGRELIEILNTRWRELAPILLFYNNSCVDCSELEATNFRNDYSDFLRGSFMQGNNFSAKSYRLLENMFTRVLFVDEIKKSANLHRKYGKGKVFLYEYRNPLSFSIGNWLSNRSDLQFGASHGADLVNVLPLKFLEQPNATNPNPPYSECIGKNLIRMGIELSTSGMAVFNNKKLPVNNATHTGKMTIFDTYFTLDSCVEDGSCENNVYNYTGCN